MDENNQIAPSGRFTPYDQIEAEGEDWFGVGYEVADDHVKAWEAGKIALGKPVSEQPASPTANRLFREGFNKRIQEHMVGIIRLNGLSASGQAAIFKQRTDMALGDR